MRPRRSPETTTRQGRTFRAVREYAPFHAGTQAPGHAGLGAARARERAWHPAAMRHAGEHRGTFREKPAFPKRLRELVWVGGCVTAPAAWASGPSALASWGPWGRRRRGTRGPARSRERPCVTRRGVHRLAKTAPRRRFGALVYTVAPLVATQVASGGTSAPTAMACRRRLLGGRLSLGQ